MKSLNLDLTPTMIHHSKAQEILRIRGLRHDT